MKNLHELRFMKVCVRVMTRTSRLYDQLQTSGLSIPDLMEQNGLTNYKTFLRTFHDLYGTTPQKMRRSL